MRIAMIALLAGSSVLAGCAGYENTTRDATTGALLGAAAGAVIGNNTGSGDAASGAAIGAAVGAAGGAAVGCEKDGRCPWSRNNSYQSQLYTDRHTGREYYVNQRDGCTYWRNGEYRSC